MGDLRIGIGASGDRQCAQPLATQEQCVFYRNARGSLSDVREFIAMICRLFKVGLGLGKVRQHKIPVQVDLAEPKFCGCDIPG